MSSSPKIPKNRRRSKPAADNKTDSHQPSKGLDKVFSIELVHARSSHLTWLIACGLLGGFLVLNLAILGQIAGAILLAIAAWSGYKATRTFLHPAGTLRVDRDEVDLPVGLCSGKKLTIPISEIAHVYILRRAVSWTRSGATVVVETGDRVIVFPRDWFDAATDQTRLLRGLNRRLGRL